MSLLSLRNIAKSFGAIEALRGVDLDIQPGEAVGLMGDNGAGKSTLVKIIAGNFPQTTGTIEMEGRPVHFHRPIDARGVGIEVVYQDLALCDNLDIVENMFLGRELKSRGMLDEARMETMARDALTSLSVRTVKSVRQPVSSLSGGQRQTVAIAKSVLWNSKVVLLDEPTAALGVAQTRQVIDLVRRLAAQGLGVVLISHNMNDVFQVADRIAEYAEVGIDEFIFSGYPHLEELYWFGEGVVPILRERGLFTATTKTAAAPSIPFVGGSR